MTDKLYIFANIGHLDEVPKSGGQSSARRVINGFKEGGLEIVPIRRHRGVLEGKFYHKLETCTFAVIDTLKVFFTLLFGRRKNSAFMHFSYSQSLTPLEVTLSQVARFLGYKTLLYLKGGKVKEFVQKGTEKQMKLFRKNLDLQEKVFFEGSIDVEICKELTSTPLVYFPNYIFDKNIGSKEKPMDKIGMCYFGKIAPDKNVHVVLEAFEILAAKHPNMYLTVVGGLGSSKAYYDKFDESVKSSPVADRITRVGASPFEFLLKMMEENHFFLFPSQGRCEGHSNSLNEAMSQGLIPIVSDWGFNRGVVGDDRFVVDGFDAKDYAAKIEHIIETCDLQELSKDISNYLRENFAYSKVSERICNEIKNI